MQNSWLVLLPPVVVLLSAFLTRRLNLSLSIGLAAASLIAMDGNPLAATTLGFKRLLLLVSSADSIYLYIFLIAVSMLVVVLERTGGARAFAQALAERVNNARGAETSAMVMSTSLFIDDYLSTLTVGNIMRPVTDRFAIPRVKLAFIIHTLAAPLVILSPISTWVGVLTSQLSQAGIAADPAQSGTKIVSDPLAVYVLSIPFIFYSLIMIASLWFIVRARISFGPMHKQEEIAKKSGNLFGGQEAIRTIIDTSAPKNHGRLLDFILPLATLIGTIIVGMLYAGGYSLFGGPHSFVQALEKNDQTALILVIAGLLSVGVGLVRGIQDKHITADMVPAMVRDSVLMIYGAIIMLALVSTLGVMLKDDLQTGQYLATTLQGTFNAALLPCIFFVAASICSIMIGSSWGTIALLVPIAIPMLISFNNHALPIAVDAVPLLFPLIGAIFGGAVCGDHLSPMSQTTVMAASSAGCYPLDHVQTQFPYAIPTIVSSIIASLIAGYLAPHGLMLAFIVSFSVGLLTACAALYLVNRIFNKHSSN